MSQPIWLHEPMDKNAAEALLPSTLVDGQFCVRGRPGHETDYVLCVVYRGKPTHHLVTTTGGSVIINKKDYGGFTTISQLVEGLSKPGVTGWPVPLTAPIPTSANSSLSWLHEAMPNTQANTLLQGNPDGMFLIRKRADTTDNYVVSVNFRGKPTHHLAAPNDNGTLLINKQSFNDPRNIRDLITTLAASTLPKGWPVRLTTFAPVAKGGATTKSKPTAAAAPTPKAATPKAATPKAATPKAIASNGKPTWLHPVMSNKAAESLFTEYSDGIFLIRVRGEEFPNNWIISVTFRGKPTHHLCAYDEGKGVCLVNKKPVEGCATIVDVVAALRTKKSFWPVPLVTEISRKDSGGGGGGGGGGSGGDLADDGVALKKQQAAAAAAQRKKEQEQKQREEQEHAEQRRREEEEEEEEQQRQQALNKEAEETERKRRESEDVEAQRQEEVEAAARAREESQRKLKEEEEARRKEEEQKAAMSMETEEDEINQLRLEAEELRAKAEAARAKANEKKSAPKKKKMSHADLMASMGGGTNNNNNDYTNNNDNTDTINNDNDTPDSPIAEADDEARTSPTKQPTTTTATKKKMSHAELIASLKPAEVKAPIDKQSEPAFIVPTLKPTRNFDKYQKPAGQMPSLAELKKNSLSREKEKQKSWESNQIQAVQLKATSPTKSTSYKEDVSSSEKQKVHPLSKPLPSEEDDDDDNRALKLASKFGGYDDGSTKGSEPQWKVDKRNKREAEERRLQSIEDAKQRVIDAEKAEIERKKKEEERKQQQADAKPLSMLERKKSLGLLNAAPQSRPTLRRRGQSEQELLAAAEKKAEEERRRKAAEENEMNQKVEEQAKQKRALEARTRQQPDTRSSGKLKDRFKAFEQKPEEISISRRAKPLNSPEPEFDC